MAFGFVFLRFKDVATGRSVDICCEDATAHRSVVVTDMEPCVEVTRRARKGCVETDDHQEASAVAGAGPAGDESARSLWQSCSVERVTSRRAPPEVRANIARVRACWHELPRPVTGIHGVHCSESAREGPGRTGITVREADGEPCRLAFLISD
jgi:hypothetical protein